MLRDPVRCLLLLCAALLACGRTDVLGEAPADEPPPAPKIVFEPAQRVFAGSVLVTIKSDVPALVRYTADGSDPRAGSPSLIDSGPSPRQVRIDQSVLLTAQAITDKGLTSDATSAFFERGGPPPGTLAGEVLVGGEAVGKAVALSLGRGGKNIVLADAAEHGALPFHFENLAGGAYTLRAIADIDGDGVYENADLVSDATQVTLVLDDPRRAGAEGLQIYLGRSHPGLATIYGNIHVPAPQALRPLSVLLLDTQQILGGLGGGANPQVLLDALQSPSWQGTTRANQQDYPYRVVDVEPGQYLPVPVLGGLGLGGAQVTLLVNLLGSVTLQADTETRKDYAFGPSTVSGTASKLSGVSGLALGTVAFKPAGFVIGESQAAMSVTLLFPDVSGAASGDYRVEALKNREWLARMFVSTDPTTGLTGALAWALNPLDQSGGVRVRVQGDTVTDLQMP